MNSLKKSETYLILRLKQFAIHGSNANCLKKIIQGLESHRLDFERDEFLRIE
jgi:hypothetical protein